MPNVYYGEAMLELLRTPGLIKVPPFAGFILKRPAGQKEEMMANDTQRAEIPRGVGAAAGGRRFEEEMNRIARVGRADEGPSYGVEPAKENVQAAVFHEMQERLTYRVRFLSHATEALTGCQRQNLNRTEQEGLRIFVHGVGEALCELGESGGLIQRTFEK